MSFLLTTGSFFVFALGSAVVFEVHGSAIVLEYHFEFFVWEWFHEFGSMWNKEMFRLTCSISMRILTGTTMLPHRQWVSHRDVMSSLSWVWMRAIFFWFILRNRMLEAVSLYDWEFLVRLWGWQDTIETRRNGFDKAPAQMFNFC